MKGEQIKTLLILAAVLVSIVIYALQPQKWQIASIPLQKVSISTKPASPKGTATAAPKKLQSADTAVRALFIGDSMVEKLAPCCAAKLPTSADSVFAVIWYASTTKLWAETATLDYYLQKYRPTIIIVTLGSNELYINSPHQRTPYIEKIVSKIGSTPYLWVSPPRTNSSTGISDVIRQTVGDDRFFDSRHLTLERGSDNIHPTAGAAHVWADSLASYMQRKHMIGTGSMTGKPRKNSKTTILQPKFKGIKAK